MGADIDKEKGGLETTSFCDFSPVAHDVIGMHLSNLQSAFLEYGYWCNQK